MVLLTFAASWHELIAHMTQALPMECFAIFGIIRTACHSVKLTANVVFLLLLLLAFFLFLNFEYS
jgi:hypothetical protein